MTSQGIEDEFKVQQNARDIYESSWFSFRRKKFLSSHFSMKLLINKMLFNKSSFFWEKSRV
jgi:hypothetical protein